MRGKQQTGHDTSKLYEPTPAEIRRACQRIQETWSDKERRKRSGDSAKAAWTPPSISWAALTAAASDAWDDGPTAIEEAAEG